MNASPDQDRARCAFDADRARIYREQFDEQVVATSGSYRHYGDGIERISASFGRPIVALDLGCGTGRHFSCLRNVSHLVGIDVSEHMIEQARRPVLAERITVGSIELRVGDAFSEVLEPSTFDFIYSIGVLGEYVPADGPMLARLHELLRPGGIAYFTVTDARSRISEPENSAMPVLRRVARKAFPMLPIPLRVALNRRLSPHYATPGQVERLLRESAFSQHTVVPYEHLQGWRGTTLECTAWRA